MAPKKASFRTTLTVLHNAPGHTSVSSSTPSLRFGVVLSTLVSSPYKDEHEELGSETDEEYNSVVETRGYVDATRKAQERN